MKQEADVGLSQLHHAVNVHHRLLVPPAQVGTHLRLKVLQLTHRNVINHTAKAWRSLPPQRRLSLILRGSEGCRAGLGRIYRALT